MWHNDFRKTAESDQFWSHRITRFQTYVRSRQQILDFPEVLSLEKCCLMTGYSISSSSTTNRPLPSCCSSTFSEMISLCRNALQRQKPAFKTFFCSLVWGSHGWADIGLFCLKEWYYNWSIYFYLDSRSEHGSAGLIRMKRVWRHWHVDLEAGRASASVVLKHDMLALHMDACW